MDSATVNAMLAKSNGRDLIMGVAQFLPGVLLPIAEKAGNTELMTTLQSLSTLSGGYRSVTRLSSFYGLVTVCSKKNNLFFNSSNFEASAESP